VVTNELKQTFQINIDTEYDKLNKHNKYEISNFSWEELIKHSKQLQKINLEKLIPNINPELILLQENILSDISNIKLTTRKHVIPLLTKDKKVDGEFIFKTSSNKRNAQNKLIFIQILDDIKIRECVSYGENETLLCFYKKHNNNFLAVDYKIINYDKYLNYDLSGVINKTKFRDLDEKLNENDLILCMSLSRKFEKIYYKCKSLRELYAYFEFQMEDTYDASYMIKLIKSQIALLC